MKVSQRILVLLDAAEALHQAVKRRSYMDAAMARFSANASDAGDVMRANHKLARDVYDRALVHLEAAAMGYGEGLQSIADEAYEEGRASAEEREASPPEYLMDLD